MRFIPNRSAVPFFCFIRRNGRRPHFMVAMDTEKRGIQIVQNDLHLLVQSAAIEIQANISKQDDDIIHSGMDAIIEIDKRRIVAVNVACEINHMNRPPNPLYKLFSQKSRFS